MRPTRLDATYRSIFLYSKLWGMFPFYLTGGWQLRISKAGLVHSFLMVTFSIFSFCKSIMSSKSRLYNFIFLTELFSLDLTLVCSILMLIFRHRRLSDALFIVLSVQKRHGITLRCRRLLLQLWVGSLGLLVVLLYRLLELSDRSWNDILFRIAFFLPTWMMFTAVMVFSSVCLLIADSFVLTTAALLSPHFELTQLDFLFQTHFVLMTAADSVNVCYGIQNLLVFTTTFFLFTSRVYIVLNGGSTFSVLTAFFFYPSLCWSIVGICSDTKRKAKMFTEALYHSALFGKQRSLSKNTRVTFHFASIKEVQFTACGFFVIDFPLLCSMIGAAVSYLLILFQFAELEQSTSA